MKLIERLLWIIAALALAMKVMHLPLSSFLLIISISTLMMLYFFLSWLLLPSPTRKDQVLALSILAGVGISIALMGVLFKLQRWPLSGFHLLLGGTWLAGIAIAAGVVRSSRAALRAYTKGLLIRIIPLLAACCLLYALPGATLTAFYYRDEPEIGRLWIQHDSIADPVERERLRARIDSLHWASNMNR